MEDGPCLGLRGKATQARGVIEGIWLGQLREPSVERWARMTQRMTRHARTQFTAPTQRTRQARAMRHVL